jgi:hypothetical protein
MKTALITLFRLIMIMILRILMEEVLLQTQKSTKLLIHKIQPKL